MAVRAGAGLSNVSDAFDAGHEAAAIARQQIDDESPALAFVFSSPQHAGPELLEGVRTVVGSAPLLGCTDAGNFTSDGVKSRSVAVMLVHAPGLEVRPGAGDKLGADPEEAGRAMAQQARDGRLGFGSGPGTLLLTFCEGAWGNISAVVRGAQQVVGEDFPVVGAAAGDDLRLLDTTQYCLGTLLKDSAVGLLLGGSVRFGVGTRHGFSPISRPRVVTRAEGATLIEIDGAPAFELYRTYLGSEAADLNEGNVARLLSTYPLGFEAEGESESLLRFPLRLSPEGHLTCSGEIPEGSAVRLMMGSRGEVAASARRAAEVSRAALAGRSPQAAVVISSSARRRLLGREASLELQAIQDVLGENVPIVGFFAHGELAPSEHGATRFRNDAVVVLTMSEE